jgi:heme/copper-type cytochrome/quinol oxidase subunit 2
MSLRYLEIAALAVVAVGAAAGVASPPVHAQGVKEFTMVAERYKFTPDRLEVNQGDTVRITIRSADGTHGFAIKKLKVDTSVPKGGKAVTLEFVADKAGTFPITCSEYCGRGHSHMRAEIDVLPAEGHGGSR